MRENTSPQVTRIRTSPALGRQRFLVLHYGLPQDVRMAARPTVNVRGVDGNIKGPVPLPAVFTAPIRPDVVLQIHSTLN